MKFVGMIMFLFVSLTSFSHPRDSARAAGREQARTERRNIRVIEKQQRERERIMRKWDQRTMGQRKKDRQVLLFLVAGAAILVNTMIHHE